MLIKCKGREEALRVVQVLDQYLAASRFYIEPNARVWKGKGGIEIRHMGRRTFVSVLGVRLLTKKGYCGNHAGPCRFRGITQGHKNNALLEGLDWVSFNDMLNDALDSINHDGDVKSAICIIRKGRQRRTDYLGQDGGEFDKDTDYNGYEDYCGRQAPQSEHHSGTPGIIGWGKDCVEAPYEEVEA